MPIRTCGTKWLTRVNGLRILLCLIAVPACGHDPITTNLTWTNEISRLVYRHCASCHQPGGTAMSLITYEEVRPWAKAIRNEVMARRMPPFDPVRGVGDFRDDPSLTQPELDLFIAWVEGGAPEGLPANLPAKRVIEQPANPASCAGASLRVTQSSLLSDTVSICGIAADGPLEVIAVLPDQTVRRLVWIRTFHALWNRTYVFRTPQVLPKGTRVLVSGSVATLFRVR